MNYEKIEEIKVLQLIKGLQEGEKNAVYDLLKIYSPLIINIIDKFNINDIQKKYVNDLTINTLLNCVFDYKIEFKQSFLSYSISKIIKEIKHYTKNLYSEIYSQNQMENYYSQVITTKFFLEKTLNRSPKIIEIANHLLVTEEFILELLEYPTINHKHKITINI